MMKTLILFCMCVLCLEISSAQNDSLKHTCSITDFYIILGFGPGDLPDATLQDFRSLAPDSRLLSRDLSPYHEQEFYQKNNNFSGLLGFQTALTFVNKETGKFKKNLQLRFGFMYMSGRHIYFALENTTRYPTDTLTSSQTGQVIYLDSVFRDTYNMKYSSDQFRLDACLLYRFNPAARFSFYTGVGASGGLVYNATTEILYQHKTSLESADQYQDLYTLNTRDESFTEREIIKNESGTGYTIYFPLGADLRLGRKKNGPGRVHFFWEALSALNSFTVPELGNTTRPALFLTGGIRFSSVR